MAIKITIVTFEIWASNGCENDMSESHILEFNPDANFTWKYECISDEAVEMAKDQIKSDFVKDASIQIDDDKIILAMC